MKMTQATQGFLFSLRADGYSQATIDLYNYVLSTLAGFLNDPEVHAIQAGDLTRYFAYVRTEYNHAGFVPWFTSEKFAQGRSLTRVTVDIALGPE